MQAIFSSPATVAIIDAYILDLTVSRGERSTRRDGGRHWWEKFRTFNQDIRTEDFFSLPLNFNRFFPSHWVHFHFNMNKRTKYIILKTIYYFKSACTNYYNSMNLYYDISSCLNRNVYKKDIRAKGLHFIATLACMLYSCLTHPCTWSRIFSVFRNIYRLQDHSPIILLC